MARIRSIKPEFFRHEGLYELERESGLPVRLAFAGLWTAADREGRFEWRPLRLKLDILPWDPVDFDAVLAALVRGGYLVVYRDGTQIYGAIPSWRRHQVVNHRERKSCLPSPDDCELIHDVADACATRAPRVAQPSPRVADASPARASRAATPGAAPGSSTESTGASPAASRHEDDDAPTFGDPDLVMNHDDADASPTRGPRVPDFPGHARGEGEREREWISQPSVEPPGGGEPSDGERLAAQQQAADESIWRYGVRALMGQGMTEPEARRFLGGLCKHHGQDVVASTLGEISARPSLPADLRSYLPGAISKTKGRVKPSTTTSGKLGRAVAAFRAIGDHHDETTTPDEPGPLALGVDGATRAAANAGT